MTEVALRGCGLEKAFPGVRALRNVDFDVRVGEVHGLVGANAAGKSTLVKLLTGGGEPDAGVVEVFGRVVRPGDPLARRGGSKGQSRSAGRSGGGSPAFTIKL